MLRRFAEGGRTMTVRCASACGAAMVASAASSGAAAGASFVGAFVSFSGAAFAALKPFALLFDAIVLPFLMVVWMNEKTAEAVFAVVFLCLAFPRKGKPR
jgi:hypothetical protein